MSIFDKIKKTLKKSNDNEKVIDLSDSTKYPANVLSDLNYVFALGDDSENMLGFLQGKWLRPSFHWGWDDITHEAAVNSEFLQRAFYSLDVQNRKRRDAMIASEGYKFIWKNKEKEAVPGLITGEELCLLLTKSREWGLKTMKDLNASEERDARRWRLNPTYEDLMAELEKNDEAADYHYRDMGCGMLRFTNKSYGNKQSFIVNTALKKAYAITEPDGTLVGFTKDDIDWDNVSQLEHNGDAYRLRASYAFGVEDYSDGLACVSWMLYPDGRYFADSDGFGMEDNDEVNVYAYIDTECRVIIKFQDLEKARAAYQEMLKARLVNEMHSLVEELKRRMSAEVPAYGDFETVEVLKENTDKSLRLTSYGLELMQPPKGIKGRETIRGLKVVGYKGEAGLEILRTTGTVEKILNELEDKTFVDSFAEDVMKINRGASDL